MVLPFSTDRYFPARPSLGRTGQVKKHWMQRDTPLPIAVIFLLSGSDATFLATDLVRSLRTFQVGKVCMESSNASLG
jgi:hypothetical protein